MANAPARAPAKPLAGSVDSFTRFQTANARAPRRVARPVAAPAVRAPALPAPSRVHATGGVGAATRLRAHCRAAPSSLAPFPASVGGFAKRSEDYRSDKRHHPPNRWRANDSTHLHPHVARLHPLRFGRKLLSRSQELCAPRRQRGLQCQELLLELRALGSMALGGCLCCGAQLCASGLETVGQGS